MKEQFITKRFHGARPIIAQIEYINKDLESVHSDICPPNHALVKLTPEYRKMLHECLDEWLDKSGGTGCFFIGEGEYFNGTH